ncbi:hypothetical protein ACF0H5_013551 [Mactra antiquata]
MGNSDYMVTAFLLMSTFTEQISGSMYFNKKLPGVIINTYFKVSLNDCSRKCDSRMDCLSFSYNRLLHLCDLNVDSYELSIGTAALDTSPGWIIKNAGVNAINGNCEKDSCGPGEVCNTKDNTFECVFEECDMSVLSIPNGEVFGNIPSIDSKVKIECDSGYLSTGSPISQCGDTGHWINTIVCENALTACSMLEHFLSETIPNIIDAEIVVGEEKIRYTSENISGLSSFEYVFNGSSITIQCEMENTTSDIFINTSAVKTTFEQYQDNVTVAEIVCFSTLFFAIGTVGILGNILVVYIVFSDAKMRLSMTNMLIVNLAVADLNILLFGVPEIVQFMLNRGWLLGYEMCKIQRSVLVCALYASVMTLLALCVER